MGLWSRWLVFTIVLFLCWMVYWVVLINSMDRKYPLVRASESQNIGECVVIQFRNVGGGLLHIGKLHDICVSTFRCRRSYIK